MPSAIEKILDLLVQEKILSREQADDCLRTRQAAVDSGTRPSMTDLVVSKGVDAERLSKTLLMAKCLNLHCPKCRVRHSIKTVKLDSSYLCKRCGGPLEAEEVIPSGSLPIRKLEDPTPAEVVEAREDPKRVLGKYTLLRELGRGGMAVVYQAWDSLLAQYVALKVIRDPDADLPGATTGAQSEEFLREARMAARLQHANIVRVFEVGAHDGRHFLAMEYVDGQTLAQMLKADGKGARLPRFYGDVQKFLVHLRDVARALEYAHRHNPPIVHRDVKPHNILVDSKGRACLVDFGLAREVRKGNDRLTLTGVTKGTPSYMAPEQARGRHGEIDARTDVWALGAVLYEYLSGRPPFEGPTEHEILNRVLHEEPRRPSDVLRSQGLVAPVLGDLEAVCFRALEKDRARRYSSAAEFAAELDRFLTGKDVEAKERSAPTRALRWVARRKAAAAAMASAVVMAIVALVAVIHGRGDRVVERVIVQKDPSARLSQRAREIEKLAAAFRFDAAVQCYRELLTAVDDPVDRSFLQQRMEDLKIQQTMFAGLVDRIGKEQRDYDRFRVATEPAGQVRVLDATRERLLLRRDGRLVEQPWSTLDPQQFVTLVRDYWPDLDGHAALGFGVWCLRRGLTEEAALALRKQADPKAQRYLQEIAATSKGLAEGLEEPRERMLRSAEDALRKGDVVIARARYERVLTMRSDDPDAIQGLEKVAEAEKLAKKAPVAAAPAKTVEPPKADLPAFKQFIPDSAATLGPSLVPSAAARIEEYAAVRWESMKSMAAKDWRKSAELLRPWIPSGIALAPAIDRIAAGELSDSKIRDALVVLEGWLGLRKASDDFELQRALHLRDLLAVVNFAAETDAVLDQLIKDKVKLKIGAGGMLRFGVLERNRGKVFLVESVAGGGTATWPVLLSNQEKADLIGQAWERLGKGPSWRLRLMQEVTAAYEPSAVQNPQFYPAFEPVEQLAPQAERPRISCEDTRRLWRSKPGWRVDLLSYAYRSRWQTPDSVGFDERGMEFRGAARTTAMFDGGRLEPGMKLVVRFAAEVGASPEKAALHLVFLAPGSDGRWKWREAAKVDLFNLQPTLISYPDSSPEGKKASISFKIASGVQTYVFELSPGLLSLQTSSTSASNVDVVPPEGRHLLLVVDHAKVRIDLLQVANLSPTEPAPPKPDRAAASDFGTAMQRARARVNQKDYAGAVQECTRALQLKAEDPEALMLRSYCYNDMGDPDSALLDAEKGLSLNQEAMQPYFYGARSMAWFRRCDMKKALVDIDEARRRARNEPMFVRQRGVILLGSGDTAGALAEIEKAMSMDANRPWDYIMRGACHFITGDWKKVVTDLERSQSLGDNDDGVRLYLWLARCRLGERDAATSVLKQQLKDREPLNPAHGWDLKIAAFMLDQISEQELRQEPRKLAGFRRVAEADCEASYYAGAKRLLEGDSLGAADMFQRCLDTGMTPTVEYWSAKAELDAMAGKGPARSAAPAKPASKEPLILPPEEWTKPKPSTSTSYEMAIERGKERNRSGLFQAAVLEYTKALEFKPDDQNALYLRIFPRARAGDLEGAAADAEKGLLLPNSSKAHFTAARAYVRLRVPNLAGALADADFAILSQDKVAFFRHIRARILQASGNYAGTLAELERLMTINQNRVGDDYRLRSFLYYDTGDWANALADQKRALELTTGNDNGYHLYYWLTRARLGDREAATTELKARIKTLTPSSSYMAWDFKIASFLCSDVSEDDLLSYGRNLKDGRRVEEAMCEAYFYIGAKRLLDGDTAGASSHFRKTVDTGIVFFAEYWSARAELDAMAGKRPTLR